MRQGSSARQRQLQVCVNYDIGVLNSCTLVEDRFVFNGIYKSGAGRTCRFRFELAGSVTAELAGSVTAASIPQLRAVAGMARPPTHIARPAGTAGDGAAGGLALITLGQGRNASHSESAST